MGVIYINYFHMKVSIVEKGRKRKKGRQGRDA